ncbi:HI1506-related protein [Vibrio cholerae]|uniref:HI1506-related protein n=1 Tax=Vibrio cholerae TaxID=666 RepID=UPI00115C0A8C|nr:HI1506-related protein [Vibrio cholerae]TQQ34448.1 hypothetical protein FLL66_02210 [Vibrio cholerae]
MSKTMQTILVICAAHSGYRRAGVEFQKGENVFAGDSFSDNQIAQIEADPRLKFVLQANAAEITPITQGDNTAGLLDSTGVSTALSFGDAIAQLDRNNPDHFTSAGKPQLGALEPLMQQPLTAKQRDELWEAHNALPDTTQSEG